MPEEVTQLTASDAKKKAEQDRQYTTAIGSMLENVGLSLDPNSLQGARLREMFEQLDRELENSECDIGSGAIRDDLIEQVIQAKLVQNQAFKRIAELRRISIKSKNRRAALKLALDMWNTASNVKLKTLDRLGISSKENDSGDLAEILKAIKEAERAAAIEAEVVDSDVEDVNANTNANSE